MNTRIRRLLLLEPAVPKHRWRCIECGLAWKYEQLTKKGMCPSCGGVVRMETK